jgi:aminoglycoside phosphotransferase (APT) family kinase protein
MAEMAEEPKLTRSDRDHSQTADRLSSWLSVRLGSDAEPVIDSLVSPEKNGMSSETLLVDATWTEGGERSQHKLVARLEPPMTAVPVFPSYQLDRQFDTMRLVAERSGAPIPKTYWLERDAEPIGAPFFVMERVDGEVPPDVMPYNMGSWLSESSAEEQANLERSTIEVLAQIHGIADSANVFAFLAEGRDPSVSPLRAHFDAQREYYRWSNDGEAIPVLDAAFDHLEATWPEEEPESVLSWGDSRIGNMMYRDHRPVAVFDWEMAAIGPRELDLAWLIFLHRFFEDICIEFGLPGMPEFLERGRVEAVYEELSGHRPQAMDWFLTYAALRHGVVMSRVKRRSIHFGEDVVPETADGYVLHSSTIRKMIDGTYW